MNGRRPFSLSLRTKAPARGAQHDRSPKQDTGNPDKRAVQATATSVTQREKRSPDSERRISYASSIAESDISGRVKEMETWFGSPATDEESSAPGSPTEQDWPQHSTESVLQRAKEAFLEDGSHRSIPVLVKNGETHARKHSVAPKEVVPTGLATADGITALQSKRSTLPARSPSAERPQSIPPLNTNKSSTFGDLSASKSSGDGILRRLRRIKKREKNVGAFQSHTPADLDPQQAIVDTALSPAEIDDAKTVRQGRRGVLPTSDDESEDEKLRLPSKSATKSVPVREALVTERVPDLRPKRQLSIHSIEPSLVDGESDTESTAPEGSPVTFAHEMQEVSSLEDSSAVSDVSRSLGKLTFNFKEKGLDEPSFASESENLHSNDSSQEFAESPARSVQGETIQPVLSAAEVFGSQDKRASPSLSAFQSYDTALAAQDSDPHFLSAEPLLPEDDATTPRASEVAESHSYFEERPVRSESSHRRSQLAATQRQDWRRCLPISAQQRHCLVRHMIERELGWEAERLFLAKKVNDLESPHTASQLPRTDIAYLKASPGRFRPNLPIIRFLFKHIVRPCPIFGTAHPMKGAGAQLARATNAKESMDAGLLPILRFVHQLGLSQIAQQSSSLFHDEQNSSILATLFHAMIAKPLTLYLCAYVDKEGKSIDWASVKLPSRASFLSHRVPMNKLRQGGYEVNVIGARLRPGSNESGCELVLQVRRFGFPPTYVIRTEDDFYTFARVLAEKMGIGARIRPVPLPARSHEHALPESRDEGSDQMSSLGHQSASPKKLSLYHGSLSGSTASLQALAYPQMPSSTSSLKLFGVNSNVRGPSTDDTSSNGDRVSVRTSTPRLQKANNVQHSTMRPPVFDEEARRKQIRAWLRDALSVQGAGHVDETFDFLQLGALNEKDLKSSTKEDIKKRLDIDDALMTNRQQSASEAPREVAELRAELQRWKRDAIEGDGLIRTLEHVKKEVTFSGLPLRYQQLISWMNLHVATLLFNAFLNCRDSLGNFGRFKELVQAIPWKALSASLRGPTGLMIQRIASSFGDTFVRKKLLAILLDDVPPKKVEQELVQLRKRLGSVILRKLENYVAAPAWQKKLIEQAGIQAGIPLVCAIVRGSDKPLLATEGIKRIVSATKTYHEFINSHPSRVERKIKIKTNADVRLIFDMQRALQVLSSQRNGRVIRAALDSNLKPALDMLLDPLLQLFKRFHRAKILQWTGNDGKDIFAETHSFLLKLIDVIAGLRVRVQDPWRSLSTLVLLLDDAVPSWYRRLHHCSHADPLLNDVAGWLQDLAHMLHNPKAAEDILAGMSAQFESKKDAISKSIDSSGNHEISQSSNTYKRASQPFSTGGEERDTLDLLFAARQEMRSRQVETACRWAAGDADAELAIQLMGEGGKTRTTMYEMPDLRMQPSAKAMAALDHLRPGFHSSLCQYFDQIPSGNTS